MKREEALKIAKPILFNTDMVRAILDGRKTVTRRVIKPRFRENERGFFTATIAGQLFICYSDEDDNETRRVKSPYQVGDILYVRETWLYEDDLGDHIAGYIYKAEGKYYCNHWKPSIHMPKEAARIFLRVMGVRVERLQDIDDDGVVAEGLEIGAPYDELWNSTVKKSDLDKYGWAANPWVWVIEFEKLEVMQ